MRVLILISGLALSALLGASCGGSNQCADGCNREKSCAEKLNCAALDPLEQPQCEQRKKAFTGQDCGRLSTYCPSDVKAHFEQAATCALNPVTCECGK